MFRPLPMLRLNLLVLAREERTVLQVLAQSGAIQLVRTQAGAEIPPHDHASQIAKCVHLASQIEELQKSLGIAPPTQMPPEPRSMSLEEAEEQLRWLRQNAAFLLNRRQDLLDRCAKLTSDFEQLSKYQGLDIPLAGPDHYSFLHFLTGTLPAENLERLQLEIAVDVALLPLPQREGRRGLIAMTSRHGKAALERALGEVGFQPEQLPAAQGETIDSFLQNSQNEQELLSAELRTLDAELRGLAGKSAGLLSGFQAAAERERRFLEAEQSFPCTGSAILISGWVPANDVDELQQRVKQVTGGRCAFETIAPDSFAGEQAPILLRHPWWLRPFAMLVSAYGLPSYQELEPTLFVAITYLLMFGMMFGDLGHGAVLALGGLTVLLFAARRAREMGLLLLFAGLSSMAFGLTYGSCFGLPGFKKYALWRDPLEGNLMSLMSIAIGIGVCMISLGMLFNIFNRFHRGDVIGGFLDKFGLAGVLFYWGVLLLLCQFQAIQARGLAGLAIILFLVLPVVGWALKEPLEYLIRHRANDGVGESLFGAGTESIVGAFEAVLSYLANTISFVRLAAYAMSHAALLAAAFVMAGAVRHIPVGGGCLSLAVIIFGNLVAIVLEGIIASVQALRLEYYEFFGKFFSGTGRPFEPFRLTKEIGGVL